MGFRDILEIYRLLQGHIRDLYVYTYLPKEKNSQPTRLQPIFWGVVGTVTWLLGWFWNIFWGWLVDQPFSGREFFSHWTVICNQFAWRTATWDGSNLNCLRQSAGQFYSKSEKWKLVFSHKKFGLQESTCTPATTRNVQLFRDGFFPGRFSACGSREALPCVRVHVIVCAIFAQPHCNRQIGL